MFRRSGSAVRGHLRHRRGAGAAQGRGRGRRPADRRLRPRATRWSTGSSRTSTRSRRTTPPSSAATPRASSRPARSIRPVRSWPRCPTTGRARCAWTTRRPRPGCARSTTPGWRWATRLDIQGDTDLGDELDDAVLHDPTSTRVFQLSVYAYLGYLQESLLNALPEIELARPSARASGRPPATESRDRLRPAGARDRDDHRRLGQHPGQATRCGLTPCVLADPGERREASRPAPRPCRCRRAASTAGTRCPARRRAAAPARERAERRRELVLHRHQPPAEDLLRLPDLVRVGVRDAGQPDLALVEQVADGADRVRVRHLGVGAVELVEADRVDAEALERGLARPLRGTPGRRRRSRSRRRGAGARPWWRPARRRCRRRRWPAPGRSASRCGRPRRRTRW